MSFAKHTKVPVEQSRSEIEKILRRYGANQFGSSWSSDKAIILFRMEGRFIRIEMPTPQLETETRSWARKKGHFYSKESVAKETRRRWRALVLYLKAKLESVESQIVSFEQAFMAHVLLPNKQTVGEFMKPQIDSAYADGSMPKQLPGY